MTKAVFTTLLLITAGCTVAPSAMAQFGFFNTPGVKAAQERSEKIYKIDQLEREGKIEDAIALSEVVLKETASESRLFFYAGIPNLSGSLKMRFAKLHSKKGDHERAVSMYEEGLSEEQSSNVMTRALASRPQGALFTYAARQGLIDICVTAKQYEKAERLTLEFRKQLSKLEGWGDWLVDLDNQLGEIALAQGDKNKAEKYFLSAIKESDASAKSVDAAAPGKANMSSIANVFLGVIAVAREQLAGAYKNIQVGDGNLHQMLESNGLGAALEGKSDDAVRKASPVASMYGALVDIYVERKDQIALRSLYATEFKRTSQQVVRSASPSDIKLDAFGKTPVAIEQMEFKFARAFSVLGMGQDAQQSFEASLVANDDRSRKTFSAFTLGSGDGAFVVRRDYVNAWISSALKNQGGDINGLFSAIASSKGIGLDYGAALPRAVRSMTDERLKSDFERLLKRKETPFQLRPYADAENKKAMEFAGETTLLENSIRERLKPQLAEQFVKSGLVHGAITTTAVFDALKPDSAYIEFVRFSNLDVAGKPTGPARYAAIVLNPTTKRASLTDLGEAGAIDSIVASYGMEIRAMSVSRRLPNEYALKRMGRALFDKTIKAALGNFDGKTTLVISPDSELNLVPFEALVDETGAYLVDKIDIQFVASARELLRRDTPASGNRTAVIFANPDFDGAGASSPVPAAGKSTRSLALRSARGTLLRDTKFDALPDSRAEGEAAKLALSKGFGIDISLFMGKDASPVELFRLNGPRFLHLATHGFFLERGKVVESASDGGNTFVTYDPSQLSGVVLAGANYSLAKGDDSGLVYANRIAALNLNGTELAVISACETGVGVVEAGEGVLGIKRALSLAGAQASITTLWGVASAETTELMSSFYAKLAEKKDRAAALRAAKLELKEKLPNPFFWAAFVLSGTPSR